MTSTHAKFNIGQLIVHRLFHYRGVIIDIDPSFQGTEEWYEQMARSKPPKDRPWYHVLVDNAEHQTYVAEQNLEQDDNLQPINHPMIDMIFASFQEGNYQQEKHHH